MAEGEGIEPAPLPTTPFQGAALPSANLPKSYYTLLKKTCFKIFLSVLSFDVFKYTDELVSILKMLKNIEEDLNLIQYSETEKKIYYTIACKNANDGSCCISDVLKNLVFQDQLL